MRKIIKLNLLLPLLCCAFLLSTSSAQENPDDKIKALRLESEQALLGSDFQNAFAIENQISLVVKGLGPDDHRVIDNLLETAQLKTILELKDESVLAVSQAVKWLSASKQKEWADRSGPTLGEAKKHFQELKRLLGADQPLVLQAKIRIAEVLSTQRRYRDAVKLLSTCIPECEQLWSKLHPNTIYCKRRLADVYYWLRESQKSADLLEACLQDSSSIAGFPQSQTIDMLMSLGKSYVGLGRFNLAEKRYDRVKVLLKKSDLEDSFEYANCLLLVGAMHVVNSDPGRAENDLTTALKFFEANRRPGDPFRTTTRNYLASCKYNLGDLRSAKGLYKKTLAECNEHLPANHPSKSACYHWLGKIAAEQGDFIKQSEYFRRSYEMDLAIWGPAHPNSQSSLASLAATYLRDCNYEKAEKLYRLAIENQEKGDPSVRILTILYLSDCLIRSGKFDSAGEALAMCKRLSEKYKLADRLLAKMYFRESELAFQQGRLSLAIKKLQAVEGLMPKLTSDTTDERIRLKRLRGSISVQQGELENAVAHFRQAIELEGQSVDRLMGIKVSTASLENLKDQQRSFHLYCSAYLDWVDSNPGEPADVGDLYDQVIRFKGQVSENQRLVNAVKKIPVLNADFTRLRQVNSLLANRLSGRKGRDRRSTLEITREKNDLEQKLAAEIEKRDLSAPITLESVEAAILPNEVLLDFITYQKNGATRLLVFVVQRDLPLKLVRLGEVASIADDLDIWSKGQGESVAAQKAAVRLYDRIWRKLESSLAKGNEIIISPDGPIGLIPFGVLPDKTTGRFLVEDHLITYQISARRLVRQRASSRALSVEPPKLLVVGDPVAGGQNGLDQVATYTSLPNAANEIEQVGRQLRRSNDSAVVLELVRENATIENLIKNAADCTHLHIATHGFWNGPELNSSKEFFDLVATYGQISGCSAGIVLSSPESSQSSPSLLSADDVSHLNLDQVDQVVLSGCHTGSGIWKAGEGTASLQRSFHVAGAKTVVASLWAVPDSATTELMNRYYENLFAKGMSKGNALRQAQIDLLKRVDLQNDDNLRDAAAESRRPIHSPFRWGGFILSGDKR